MNGSEAVVFLIVFLLAIVFCVLPVYLLANPGLMLPMILTVVFSVIIGIAFCVALAYGGSKR